MELDAVDVTIVAERLGIEGIVVGQMDRARGDLEGLPMPLVEHRGPFEIGRAGRRRVHRMVADLDQTVGMRTDPGPEHARDHLGAETDPEQRYPRRQRGALEPVQLGADARQMIVIRALRAAEHDGGGVRGQVVRQRIAEIGTAPVQRATALQEKLAHPAGVRVLLVNDDQNLFGHASQLDRSRFLRTASASMSVANRPSSTRRQDCRASIADT